jgi:signal peptidase I
MTDSISSSRNHGAPEAAVSAEVALAEAPPIDQSTDVVSRSRVRPLRTLVNLLHDLAIAVVICVFLITYVVQAFKVQGSSMAPELVDGERILVNKFLYRVKSIERGDVVVFWYPEDPDVSFIKRVVGLPRDRIEINSGVVFVNGEPVKESYVMAEFADDRSYPPREVRAGHYFVLGDNRQGSNDSRSWGVVPERYIYGKAFFRIWPLDEIGVVE